MPADVLTNDAEAPAADDAIRAVVTRLSRPAQAGGSVIERAAILAEGAHSEAIVRWIIAHAGRPEASTPPAHAGGLHGARLSGGGADRHPPRYVLPAGVLANR
jgi:hypothetical protein